MNDVIKAIGFPVALTVMIMAWVSISTDIEPNSIDIIVFFMSAISMMFMWIYNRNEYLKGV